MIVNTCNLKENYTGKIVLFKYQSLSNPSDSFYFIRGRNGLTNDQDLHVHIVQRTLNEEFKVTDIIPANAPWERVLECQRFKRFLIDEFTALRVISGTYIYWKNGQLYMSGESEAYGGSDFNIIAQILENHFGQEVI